MTTISSKTLVSSKGGFSVFSAIENFFAKRAVYSKTVRELSRLNERELEDLGLTHADINRVARQAVAML